jgi:hypothetical protein
MRRALAGSPSRRLRQRPYSDGSLVAEAIVRHVAELTIAFAGKHKAEAVRKNGRLVLARAPSLS